MKWRNVEKELPEEGAGLLILENKHSGDGPIIGHFYRGFFFLAEAPERCLPLVVTHWFPIKSLSKK